MGKVQQIEQGRQALKVAVFGGAFNPVHNGHINLAKKYIELLKPDKMLIIPTANPPHRENNNFEADCHRFNMLKLAFEHEKNIEISDIEFKIEGKSYTYNTVCEIEKQYENADIYLIVGEDQFLYFDKWYKWQELLKKVTLCTAERNKDKACEIRAFAENVLHTDKYILAGFDPVVVSSSEIREKLKNNESVDRLIPEKVLNYINENELYGRKNK